MKRTQAVVGSLIFLLALSVHVGAQEEDPSSEQDRLSVDLGLEAAFGVTSFTDGETAGVETYQLLALRPEIAVGRFGIGLDMPFNYRFTGGDGGDDFEVRAEDWVPDEDTSFLELYLPKFRYARYGRPTDDLHVQVGNLPGATIGNGFIVSGYTNELYLPNRRITGMRFGVAGLPADQRYLGMEGIVSNVAAWDLMAGRLYARPLAGTTLPLVPDLQVGVTVATDRNPYYFAERDPHSPFHRDAPSHESVLMWGMDVRQPILANPAISLAAFGDLAFQEDRLGGMVGAGGRIFGILIYGAQIRITQDNFVPEYFDNTYDRRRVQRLRRYTEEDTIEGGAGWWTRIGFSLLGDAVVFTNEISGPFSEDSTARPEIRSRLVIAEGVVPGFAGLSAEAAYTKFNIRRWNDFTSAEDAIIGARVNIRSGPVVVSLTYDLVYDPNSPSDDPWIVSSGLETAITF